MPKRQSADISPSASTRSRSTIANKPATSFALVLCGRSQPLSAHCFKLIFASNYKQPRLAEHRCHEMLASLPSRRKLLRTENVRVDFAAQFPGNARQQFAELPQTDCTYHHQVQVATRFAVAGCHRTEHESDANSRMSKRIAQNVYQPAGLENHVSNVWIERVVSVGMVIGPVSISPRLDHSETGEALELLANGSIGESRSALDL